jgi:hypothetical protein
MTMTTASFVLLALLAQTAAPTGSPEAKARAQALVKEGTKLYDRGSLGEALEKFKQAYAEYASPKLFFNIGQANRDLGRPVEAIESFERFMGEVKDAAPEVTAEARKSVAELKTKVGSLLIECATAGAEIGVDGKPVGLTPLANSVRVTPGNHQVTAKHSTGSLAMEDVNVRAGTVETVVLRLRAVVEPVAVAPTPAPAIDLQARPAPSALPAEADQGWWLGRKWTWVAAGSTVVFTGVAAIFGARMQSRFDSLHSSCGSASQRTIACNKSDIDSVTTLKNTANIFWGLAGAAAVTTGILFFVEGRPVTVAPLAGRATGLLASLRY